MIPKKIMFAISDTGGGHRSAAAALIAALDTEADINCNIIDFLRATAFPGLKQAPEIYDYCSRKHLWLNNLFFRKTNSVSRINALTKMVYFQSRDFIERELSLAAPDAVVAVHPLVIGLLHLTRERSRASWPIITVVTDLVTIHASWATPGADLYLVPTEEAFYSLMRYGIPSNRIIYTGFPIHPKFVQRDISQDQARQELGVELDRYTVLITGGGVGAGNMAEWVTALENECADKQILVVTGNNKQLYQELLKRKNSSRHIHVYGFVNNMETLMAASDIVVSKAGPGTIMEGVAMKRPLIITEAVGIQETGNIDYIENNRLGYYCPTPKKACKTINEVASRGIYTSAGNNKTVITTGSRRIADIIMQQINTETAARGSMPPKDQNIFRGA